MYRIIFYRHDHGKSCCKNCWIGTKIGVIVDMDPLMMIVVCGKICGKMCCKNVW